MKLWLTILAFTSGWGISAIIQRFFPDMNWIWQAFITGFVGTGIWRGSLKYLDRQVEDAILSAFRKQEEERREAAGLPT